MASWAASAADEDAGAPSFADDDDAIGAIDRVHERENYRMDRGPTPSTFTRAAYQPQTRDTDGRGRVRRVYPDFSPPQTHIVFIPVFTHIDTIDYGLYNAQ